MRLIGRVRRKPGSKSRILMLLRYRGSVLAPVMGGGMSVLILIIVIVAIYFGWRMDRLERQLEGVHLAGLFLLSSSWLHAHRDPAPTWRVICNDWFKVKNPKAPAANWNRNSENL